MPLLPKFGDHISDSIHKEILDLRSERTVEAVVDEGGFHLVAALLEKASRWDIARNLICVANGPKTVCAKGAFESLRVVHDHFPSNKDEREILSQAQSADRQ